MHDVYGVRRSCRRFYEVSCVRNRPGLQLRRLDLRRCSWFSYFGSARNLCDSKFVVPSLPAQAGEAKEPASPLGHADLSSKGALCPSTKS